MGLLSKALLLLGFFFVIAGLIRAPSFRNSILIAGLIFLSLSLAIYYFSQCRLYDLHSGTGYIVDREKVLAGVVTSLTTLALIIWLVVVSFFSKPPSSSNPQPPHINSPAPETPDSSLPTQPAPPVKPTPHGTGSPVSPRPTIGTVSAGDCGVIQIGGTQNQVQGGNCAPSPKISWIQDTIPEDVTKHRVCVTISIDKAMDSPKFGVVCDRACEAVGGGAILPHGGPGGGDQWGSIQGQPNVAAFVVGQPNPMPSNVKYRACVQSADDNPVAIVDVKKLVISGKTQ